MINSARRDRGGAERIARRLHAGLEDRDVPAALVSLEGCEGHDMPGLEALNLKTPYAPSALPRLAAALDRLIEPGDVVHGHLFPTGFYLAMLKAAGRLRAPLVYTEHSTFNRRRGNRLLQPVEAFTYGRFDRVFAISDGVAEALRASRPGVADKLEVIENGVALRHDRMPDRPVRDCPILISVGGLRPAKNQAAVLDALARLKGRAWRYVMLGDGPLRPDLEQQARTLGLSERVEFRGHVDDPGPDLVAADIFVMPSLWEGFGLAAVEAMNAGLPVIASDVPGLSEVVGRDGACARLVEARDVDALARAIEDLLDDAPARQRLGREGFARARRYDAHGMVTRYCSAYRGVLEASRHGR